MAELVTLHTAQVLHRQEPAPTALRVAGVPRAQVLSALDSIVPVTNDERRMMPEHAWDWRMMISLASGRVAHHTGAVGGPISANRMGKPVAPGAVVQQTCQTMASLSQGLGNAGADGYALVILTVGSPSQGAAPASRRRLHPMRETIEAVRPTREPTRTCCNGALVDAGHHHTHPLHHLAAPQEGGLLWQPLTRRRLTGSSTPSAPSNP